MQSLDREKRGLLAGYGQGAPGRQRQTKQGEFL